MKVTTENSPQREVLLNIEVESEEMEKHMGHAYRRMVKRVVIPGFRKGKAPRHIVEQFLGREQFLKEALESLLPEVTTQAIKEQDLQVVGQPNVELAQLEPVVIQARVALKPEVALGDYNDIRIQEEDIQVTQEQVETVLKQIQRDMAPWEPVDRAVKMGDLVNLDVRGFAGDDEIANNNGVDYLPQEGNPTPLPGFAEALVGVKPGETKEFTLTMAEEYSNANLAGKECSFTVSVTEVKEKNLPTLDDEFAKSLGEGTEVDSLSTLGERIREHLTQDAQRAANRRYEDQVLSQVVGDATVTMADLLVENEVEHMIREQQDALHQRRVTMEDYLQTVGKDAAQFQEELRPAAQERLTHSLVLQRVAEVEGLEVSEDELRQEVEGLTKELGEESTRKMMDSRNGKESLRRVFLTRKTTQLLTDIARGHKDTEDNQGQRGASADTNDAPEKPEE